MAAAEAAVATRALRCDREGVSIAKDMRSAYSSAVGSWWRVGETKQRIVK